MPISTTGAVLFLGLHPRCLDLLHVHLPRLIPAHAAGWDPVPASSTANSNGVFDRPMRKCLQRKPREGLEAVTECRAGLRTPPSPSTV